MLEGSDGSAAAAVRWCCRLRGVAEGRGWRKAAPHPPGEVFHLTTQIRVSHMFEVGRPARGRTYAHFIEVRIRTIPNPRLKFGDSPVSGGNSALDIKDVLGTHPNISPFPPCEFGVCAMFLGIGPALAISSNMGFPLGVRRNPCGSIRSLIDAPIRQLVPRTSPTPIGSLQASSPACLATFLT